MNPLLKVKETFQNGVLPEKEYSLIVKRFPIVVSGISRIEKASGVDFQVPKSHVFYDFRQENFWIKIFSDFL